MLGVGDGLIANVSLILGVAGASPNASAIRLAGAFSMAAGELVSVKAHDDLVEHEIEVERDEIQSESDASSQPRTVPAACRPSTPTRWRAS